MVYGLDVLEVWALGIEISTCEAILHAIVIALRQTSYVSSGKI